MQESTPASSKLADRELLKIIVRRAKKRETAAFEILVDRYKGLIGNLLRGMIDQRETIEDLSQETWVRAWKALPETNADLNFQAWLCQIATNVALDHLRRERRIDILFFPEWEEEEYGVGMRLSFIGPEKQVVERACIEEAFAHLSPQMRLCILLADQWGFSLKEIASILSISEKCASAHLSRGRKRFCQVYKTLVGGSSVRRKGKEQSFSDGPTITVLH